MTIAIIGAGAAGFFASITAAENHPEARIILFEKSQKLLSKVKISGGGRCNVTNDCTSISELCKAYPRGGKKLKKAFRVFSTSDIIEWFESRGVPLYTQDDGRVFPKTDSSQTIIDCLISEAKRCGVEIELGVGVRRISPKDDGLKMEFIGNKHPPAVFDKVIVATGGSPKRSGLEWLEALGHKIENPVPSLFTFNMPGDAITELMGISVENAGVNIQGTKLKSEGPLLITHWGMSGPAILKLSAFGARILSELDYNFNVQVNWVDETNQEVVMENLKSIAAEHPKRKAANIKPFALPERLWLHFLAKSDIPAEKTWGELGKKALNKLVISLTNDIYSVKGKTTFKEEFVTCGGVSLDSIDLNTMQSKVCKNLYFAGELMDIDAITGGYNFQAAWTTGYIAGTHLT